MKIGIPARPSGERGIALLYAAFGAFVAAGLVSMLLTMSLSSNEMAEVKRGSTRAQYMAEGAVEAAKKVIQQSVANFKPAPAGGQVTIDGWTVPYTIQPTGFNTIETDADGLQALVSGFRVSATANIDGHQAVANKIVNIEAVPVFQFAVFYTNDLEINPGPNMTLGGRVHSNRDMFLNSGGTLTVDTNYLRAVGNMYRHRKDDPSVSNGIVEVRQWVADPFDPSEPTSFVDMYSWAQMNGFGIATTSGFDSAFTGYDANGNGQYTDPGDWPAWGPGALQFWGEPAAYGGGVGNTVQTGVHGMTELVTPSTGSIAMFEAVPSGGDFVLDTTTGEYVPAPLPGSGTHDKGYYHAEADLSIITHDDGSWEAFDQAGNAVNLPAGVVNVTSMYDARQAGGTNRRVRVTEIDVDLLNASGHFPANGLLYSGSYNPAQNHKAHGTRLTNGAELAGPLTVVTESSLYVQGDYNTVNKKGASVIADAVSLLSNSWDDSKTQGTLPSASDTTFNVAIVTGNHDTVGAAYNGGLENLPRFHENWSGRDCNIVGSFVNIWLSQYATGNWKYGSDRYTAPVRNWAYDPSFNDVANLPPYTPMAVSAVDVVSF